MNREKIRFALLLTLQVFLGCVFVVSAISKLLSVEKLEFTIVENLHLSWSLSVILSRLVIGFELFIGLFLIAFPKNVFIKKLSFITLCVFTIYLVVIYIMKGNEKDCGCFGELIELNTVQSIVKNLILMVMNFLVFYQGRTENISKKIRGAILVSMLIISMGLVFYKAPLYSHEGNTNPGITLNWELLYHHPTNPKPEIDMKTGKHILAFLSTSCNHCKQAAYKLGLLHDKYPEVSLFYIINGYDDEIDPFLKITRSETVLHSKFLGPEDFQSLGGKTLPSILWVENGSVIFKKNIYEMNEDDFGKWVD